DTHDFETRVRNATRFLQEGNKVRVVIRFKGREMSHMEIGRDVMEQFEAACAEFGTAEKKAAVEGRNMSLVLSPIKNAK
ncbi:MAG: translation initiation factor IF-3, partial [Clostridia bacterium]|nr:translation initiation factor IF-3 [Clostridia bacterium]